MKKIMILCQWGIFLRLRNKCLTRTILSRLDKDLTNAIRYMKNVYLKEKHKYPKLDLTFETHWHWTNAKKVILQWLISLLIYYTYHIIPINATRLNILVSGKGRETLQLISVFALYQTANENWQWWNWQIMSSSKTKKATSLPLIATVTNHSYLQGLLTT